VDVCAVIKARLGDLGLEQKDLAAAAEVTESYISQLLTRKKLPPAPDRRTASLPRWLERSGWTRSDANTRSPKGRC
jgi:transcriptional regulator with XRE-family HTH domain